jgi:predicted DsbA family dithiol-disulfide isomerase
MQLDVYSDTICPWCYIGKIRLERALAMRPMLRLEVRWRAFQLNPGLPVAGMDRQQYLLAKFGGLERAHRLYESVIRIGRQEGIHFRFDLIRRTPNTLKSHRLLHGAAETELQPVLLERLFRAYFLEGQDIGDDEVLRALAQESGLTEAAIELALEGNDSEEASGNATLAEDMQSRRIGINGVPFFVFNGRFGLSGAQEPEALINMFDLAHEDDLAKGAA